MFTVNGDGSDVRQVTTVGGMAAEWTPDGSTIVYRESQDGPLLLIAPDGSNKRPLRVTPNPGGDLAVVAWSPDGQRLAARFLGEENVLGIANGDGRGFRAVMRDSSGWEIAWSPDGSMLAFEDRGAVRITPRDGRGSTVVADLGAVSPLSEGSWSPDGCEILVFDEAAGTNDPLGRGLFAFRWDGGAHRLVTRESGYGSSWSPTGDDILIGLSGLHLVDRHGQNRRQLVGAGVKGYAWSPDGTAVAFSAARPGAADHETTVWVVPAAGGEPRDVSQRLGTLTDW